MFKGFLHSVGNIPPVHWLTQLGLWHHAPFSWIGDLFAQHALTWVGGHFAWLLVMGVFLISAGLELVFWSWTWFRGRQIGYDEHKAKYWTTGKRAGQLKAKPIDLRKARARRFAWPRVGLPLYLVAVGMFTWYLLWPGAASAEFLAILWFFFAPVRRALFIATARRAYRANHPDDELDTTLWEDVFQYFYTGVARPAHQRRVIDPPFEDTSAVYRFLNWGHATFGRYGKFWRILRFWNFLRFWGLLVEAIISAFWPIAAVVAPFFYMWGVEDYEDWMNPWWRRYRKSEYRPKIIRGQIVADGPPPAAA
jgi:hypothetical protein